MAELTRVIDKGAKAVAFSENPTVMGLAVNPHRSLGPDSGRRPEAGLPICMHIGSSSRLITTSARRAGNGVDVAERPRLHVCRRRLAARGGARAVPRAQRRLSEGGAGWVPYVLERADKAFFDHRMDTNLEVGQKFKGKVPPSQLFGEHMYVCLVDEHFALRALGDIPVDNLLWEGDFPHGDGLWPDNRSTMEKSSSMCPMRTQRSIVVTHFSSVFGL